MRLTNHSLGIIIARVIGIYILLHAISYMAFISNFFRDEQATLRGLFSALVAFLATLGLSYIFLAHASKASRYLMSETDEGTTSEPLTEGTVVRTTFLIYGGFLVIQAIPTLVGSLSLYIQGVHEGPAAISVVVEVALRLLIGLYLVVGGGSWERFLRKLRS